MGKELVRACVFCLLCATHAHCSNAHADNSTQHGLTNFTHLNDGGGGHILNNYQDLERRKRGGDEDFVKNIFEQFGDGDTMSKAGFEKLLQSLCLHSEPHTSDGHSHSHGNSTRSSNRQCVKVEAVIGQSERVTKEAYRELCPKLVHHMISDCGQRADQNQTDLRATDSEGRLTAVWVYASVSVVMISLCGLLAVAVIPLMHHTFYQSLLQFLVALAVGTLCGDALLHLLPHAMMSSHSHGEEGAYDSEEEQHSQNLKKGLVAALAVVFFYILEKCLAIIADYRKRSQRKHHLNMSKVRVMRDEGSAEVTGSRVGEKLCKHKYSSYPYCYGEITTTADGSVAQRHPNEVGDGKMINCDDNPEKNSIIHNHKLDENDVAKEDVPCYEKQLLENFREPPTDYTTVILREHETRHHGHAHTHGHVHSAPKSMSSVAWMVILGDGVHNFTDGLAIGAAFAANIGGGISTAVAVFCHELPHEIGDFAVLLKAGMPAKQAVFYNVLSSVLCLFGMVLGVMLGHSEQTTQWVFSAAAGMFLYIALVDMIPELTSSHSTEGGGLMQGGLQLVGLLCGIFVMLTIAVYEHDLKDAFRGSF